MINAKVDILTESLSDTTPGNDSERPIDAADRLSEFGWTIEPTESGGVRMRTRAFVRGVMLRPSFCLLLPIGLFASFMVFVVGKLWAGPPEDGIDLVFLTLISLGIVGTIGLVAVGIVLQILWLLLVREER